MTKQRGAKEATGTISMLDPKFPLASPEDMNIPLCVNTADEAIAAIRAHHASWRKAWRHRSPASPVKRAPLAALAAIALSVAIAGCAGAGTRTEQSTAGLAAETIRVKLPAGSVDVDIYWPDTVGPAPLVIVAHGFSRQRRTMSGWGRELAKAGFVAVVPDLPAWSDQVRNGRFITDLRAYLLEGESWKQRLDPSRVGLMGFSAGGLASLLAAAGDPAPAIWVGLDPVDRDGIGAKAAPLVTCRTVVLTAEPSSCNANGNARGIIAALPRGEHFAVAGAVHVDAEWPTDWMAEAVCGRATDEKRGEFLLRALTALGEALALPVAPGTRGDVPAPNPR